ncbi:hypothetical protein GCM10023336_28620 [Streptomyces similanensis]|uniref:Uncharacterized protein n=1 Tax=Streptomyces similanensis TaxID=1274988 RepID=A0ABP9KG60_9ACTN
MERFEALARLLRRRASSGSAGHNSTVSDDCANGHDPDSTRGAGDARWRRCKSRAIGVVRGVSLALALLHNGGDALMFLEHVHDRGGFCSLDLVRDNEMLDNFVCSL